MRWYVKSTNSARFPHTCDVCSCAIPKGAHYALVTFFYDDHIRENKFCLGCLQKFNNISDQLPLEEYDEMIALLQYAIEQEYYNECLEAAADANFEQYMFDRCEARAINNTGRELS